MPNYKVPEILNPIPEPKSEIKVFHRTNLPGWSGNIKIDKIHGWAENRRIGLFRRKCEEQYGRPPNDNEIYEFMLNEQDLYIKELARSILYNGVKVQIILAGDGTLLDGNRRYVATRYAIEHNPDNKDNLVNMPAWVLSLDTTDEDKRKILVECNFLPDWKIDWPNYIKAMTVYEDYTDNGLEYDELEKRYGIKKTEIRKMVRVMGLIEEFQNYYKNSDESYWVAYEHYPFFEEAHNKFRGKLDNDPDFKEQFFKWVMEDKFKSYMQIRHLGEIRDNEEAWGVIRSDSPDAVDTAIHIVQGEKLPSIADGEKKIKSIIKLLLSLKEYEITSISSKTLSELKSILEDIAKMAEAVVGITSDGHDEGENK